MDDLLNVDAPTVLDCLGDGVYVTDLDRRIVYWNKTAERITGWKAEDIVGRTCFDDILCHIDKDGHHLCGKEYCPLHRSIVTGVTNECPLVFAQTKSGGRTPMQVTVAPLQNRNGETIGGIEIFRDLSAAYRDLEKARAIQSVSLQHDLPQDVRIGFTTHYVPHDIVGGDYYGIRQLNADQYGFFLADVMGHGLAAALYTMYLSALWDRYHRLLTTPVAFAAKMNDELNHIVKRGEAFAAGMCGMVDLHRQEVVVAGAGNPPALWVHANGEFEQVNCSGIPFGVMKDVPYDETRVEVHPGDRLLFFSDGAVEVDNADGKPLGVDGLIAILKDLGYPASDIQVTAIEERILKYSNAIRLDDDLTFLEIRLG